MVVTHGDSLPWALPQLLVEQGLEPRSSDPWSGLRPGLSSWPAHSAKSVSPRFLYIIFSCFLTSSQCARFSWSSVARNRQPGRIPNIPDLEGAVTQGVRILDRKFLAGRARQSSQDPPFCTEVLEQELPGEEATLRFPGLG